MEIMILNCLSSLRCRPVFYFMFLYFTASKGTMAPGDAWHSTPVQVKGEPHSPDQSVILVGGLGAEQPASSVSNQAIRDLKSGNIDVLAAPFEVFASISGAQGGEVCQLSPPAADKPFRCPKCGMAYAHQGSLVRHRHKCEGTLVLTCLFCERKFYRKDKLREHFLSKHNYIDEELGPPGYTLSSGPTE